MLPHYRQGFPPSFKWAYPPRKTNHCIGNAVPPPRASLQLIVFAFHDSKTLRETIEEGKAMQLLVTVLFLD